MRDLWDSRGSCVALMTKYSAFTIARRCRTDTEGCLAVMRRLGHERFAVVGHDRGAYVATRLALDHPEAVSAVSVLDAVPIGEALRRCDATFAASWWHWFFLGQTDKPAERVINADPDAWYKATPEQMGAEAYEDYRRAIHDPATVHAMCEDYRAGLGIDREHDERDRRDGRRIGCPLQVLWATRDDMADLYGDVLGVWRDWAGNRLDGGPLASDHHIAEEAPPGTRRRPARVLAEPRRSQPSHGTPDWPTRTLTGQLERSVTRWDQPARDFFTMSTPVGFRVLSLFVSVVAAAGGGLVVLRAVHGAGHGAIGVAPVAATDRSHSRAAASGLTAYSRTPPSSMGASGAETYATSQSSR